MSGAGVAVDQAGLAAMNVARGEYQARVARAKKIHSSVAALVRSPTAALLPPEVRGLLAEISLLLLELAQLSHAKFDMAPIDLPALVHRVDALEGLTGRSPGEGIA